jgi:hypothetical protein
MNISVNNGINGQQALTISEKGNKSHNEISLHTFLDNHCNTSQNKQNTHTHTHTHTHKMMLPRMKGNLKYQAVLARL